MDHKCQPLQKVSSISTSALEGATAANGLEIPYIGYLELDFEAQGVTIPQRGILVVKDPPDPQSRTRKEVVPGLLGMNIIQKMNEETKQLEDTAWTSTLQAVARAATSVRGLALQGLQAGTTSEYQPDQSPLWMPLAIEVRSLERKVVSLLSPEEIKPTMV